MPLVVTYLMQKICSFFPLQSFVTEVVIVDEAHDIRARLLESDSVTVALPSLLAASQKMAAFIAQGTYAGLDVRQRQTADLIVTALRQLARLGSGVVLGVPPSTVVVAASAVRKSCFPTFLCPSLHKSTAFVCCLFLPTILPCLLFAAGRCYRCGCKRRCGDATTVPSA